MDFLDYLLNTRGFLNDSDSLLYEYIMDTYEEDEEADFYFNPKGLPDSRIETFFKLVTIKNDNQTYTLYLVRITSDYDCYNTFYLDFGHGLYYSGQTLEHVFEHACLVSKEEVFKEALKGIAKHKQL